MTFFDNRSPILARPMAATAAPLRRVATAALLALAPFGIPALPASADGEFYQLDVARDTGTGVASIERGPLTFGALHAVYDGGETSRLSVLYKLPLDWSGSVRLGPSVDYIAEDGAEDRLRAGLRLTVDRYVPTSFGSIYGLAEFTSADKGWFLLGQATHADLGLTAELSYGGSETYEDGTIALSRRITGTPVSLRAGWRFVSDSFFLGVSVNTF